MVTWIFEKKKPQSYRPTVSHVKPLVIYAHVLIKVTQTFFIIAGVANTRYYCMLCKLYIRNHNIKLLFRDDVSQGQTEYWKPHRELTYSKPQL